MPAMKLGRNWQRLLLGSSSEYTIPLIHYVVADMFVGSRSFDMIYKFLQKQSERPFLKRYLKHDEILRQIAGCDASLSDSISQFNVGFLPSIMVDQTDDPGPRFRFRSRFSNKFKLSTHVVRFSNPRTHARAFIQPKHSRTIPRLWIFHSYTTPAESHSCRHTQ